MNQTNKRKLLNIRFLTISTITDCVGRKLIPMCMCTLGVNKELVQK